MGCGTLSKKLNQFRGFLGVKHRFHERKMFKCRDSENSIHFRDLILFSQEWYHRIQLENNREDFYPSTTLFSPSSPTSANITPQTQNISCSRLRNMYTLTNHRTPPPHKHPHNRMPLQPPPLSPHPPHNASLPTLYHAPPQTQRHCSYYPK